MCSVNIREFIIRMCVCKNASQGNAGLVPFPFISGNYCVIYSPVNRFATAFLLCHKHTTEFEFSIHIIFQLLSTKDLLFRTNHVFHFQKDSVEELLHKSMEK